MEKTIKKLLAAIRHPETGADIVGSGFVEKIETTGNAIAVTLHFARPHDPFGEKIKNQVAGVLQAAFPDKTVSVAIRENAAPAKPEQKTTTGQIAHIIAIASGKGGVGKSTVTANLAVALRNMGLRVGILDADIYGPSQPKMFGVEGCQPEAMREEGEDLILPAEAQGIELMSIGFFVKPTDALLWRGAMATNALRQLVHQTRWGKLDYLLIDLPPGTGDIHLSIINELHIDAAVIVSTPQQVAVADVRRGVELFRNAHVHIPVAGVIENMAFFTPAELPNNRYYLFGQGGARRFAEENGVDFLGEIPIVQSIMEAAEEGHPAAGIDPKVEQWYRDIARKIVDKAGKNG